MAALTITANSVANIDANTNTVLAGAAITAGQVVYLSGGVLLLADADASTLTAAAVGIALNPAAIGQPVEYAYGNTGGINIGATLTVGLTFWVGATAGAVNPTADLVTGWNIFRLGYATAAGVFKMDMKNYGVAVP